jgi:putative membrane-bound dehydrogenase-like protein
MPNDWGERMGTDPPAFSAGLDLAAKCRFEALMRQFFRHAFTFPFCLVLTASLTKVSYVGAASIDANRLTYLDEGDPFYPTLSTPKLTTPQWVGEDGVDAVVIMAIDDMRQHERYETVLRPILERLKQIDGRAPVSILCTTINPVEPHLRQWLQEGLSLEVHTLKHPCPLLAGSNFVAAAETYNGCVDLLNQIPGNKPVAFRMPCCDSINSPSPRFYAELFNSTNGAGQFLSIDSSVMNILTPADPALPRPLVTDSDGREKFRNYVPFPSFVTTIDNYPYPYVIGKLCWEFPAMAPSDWEAQHIQGTNSPITVADWEAALDATVIKQGTFTFIFHPHGWIRPDQMVEFIDYAVQHYGRRVKFLNFREAEERLRENLLAGQPLRDARGQDNGVRLLDLNNDGYLDVVIGNAAVRRTRIWQPAERRWLDTDSPVDLVADSATGRSDAGVRFGVLEADGFATMLVNGSQRGAWHFDGQRWVEHKSLLLGLDLDGKPILTIENGRDRGVRFRDVDQDGRCELIVGNDTQSAVLAWSPEEGTWKKLAYALPPGASIVDALGQDNGLRFVDLNDDGYDDVVFSNQDRYSVSLFVPKLYLGFQPGWTRAVMTGTREQPGGIPMIVRGGSHPNNGAWFHSHYLWVQNEDTATLPDLVDRRSFAEILGGLQPKAKSPQESLASIQVRPGFKIELVANEPLVQSPIAFEWGADGKLWVVEMTDYPLGLDGHGRPGGIVRFLEDTDGDGRYDKSTVFLDGLNFPTGIVPFGKGVIVSAAPEIFYAEDRDGDGKADFRVILFRGFREGNQQHRLNGFDYGLDNWLYGANGDSGGQVQFIGTVPSAAETASALLTDKKFDLRGHDFRFRPLEGRFETVSGQTQYGRHRDDWGNWFGNNNSIWLWHFLFPEEYLARNPDLPVKSVKEYLADYPNATRVHAVSRSLQRFNDVAMLNHVTSANSAMPYRDNLFGPDFVTSVFISEPVHNLVHREVLERDGVTFSSHRAADEQDREFLASTDNWFRPTMLKTGPDGALYVADMYRFVIEHPEWIPADSQKSLDLRAGHDEGRIYRVYPQNARLRKIAHLDQATPTALVRFMESPNGWTRDTAQRLLVQAQDKSAVPALQQLARRSDNAKARVQALSTLDGLGSVTPDLLVSALDDLHPAVRQRAIQLSEPFLRSNATTNAGPQRASQNHDVALLCDRLVAAANDPFLPVRFQLAFTCGEWPDPRAARVLVRLAQRDSAEPHFLTAVLSSAVPHIETMLDLIISESSSEPPVELFQELLNLAVALRRNNALVAPLHQISREQGGHFAPWQLQVLSGFVQGVERQTDSLARFYEQSSPELQSAIDQLSEVFERARHLATDSAAHESDRVAAIRLLGHGRHGPDNDLALLSELLKPQAPGSVQRAALANLSQFHQPEIAARLLSGWRSYEPELRGQVLGALLSRTVWTEALLDAIDRKAIPTSQISTPFQQKMLGHSQEPIRARAQKIFAITSNRRQLLQEYGPVLELKGDVQKGGLVFRQNCTTCHRLHDEGANVGPDLGALSSKSPGTLLIAILDPNQAVESRYVNYTALTKSDREISGIIVAETPSSVTLRSAGGQEETILRSDLKDLTSSRLSLMPEGFEKALTRQDLADLIAYLNQR